MQPYQSASEEIKRQGELPLQAIKTAGKLASGYGVGALGGIALSKIMPFLNKYIPENIAVQGLSRIDKRFGKFFSKAAQHGTPFEEAREYIKEKIDPVEKQEALKKFNEHKKKNKMVDELHTLYQQQYNAQSQQPQPTQQAQSPQPQGQGGIDPQLAQLLQQGNALLQKFRGNQ